MPMTLGRFELVRLGAVTIGRVALRMGLSTSVPTQLEPRLRAVSIVFGAKGGTKNRSLAAST